MTETLDTPRHTTVPRPMMRHEEREWSMGWGSGRHGNCQLQVPGGNRGVYLQVQNQSVQWGKGEGQGGGVIGRCVCGGRRGKGVCRLCGVVGGKCMATGKK